MRGANVVAEQPGARGGSARATILLSFGLVANLVTQMTFAATLHEIAAAWSLDASESGWIGGIYFAGYAIAVPFLASATDRMDGRRLYVGSALLGAAASLAFAAFAHGFILALILRFLGGVGLAGVHMPGLNLLMDRVDRSHQGRSAGIYTSSYAAGSAVSFMIAGIVDTAFGWRATFVAAGIGPLLSIGTCALLPRPLIENRSALPRPPYRALFKNRALIAYVAAFAGNTWEVFAVRVWFVAYLAWLLSLPGNHIDLPALGLVSGAASLAGVPVSMVIAEMASRYGRRYVVIGICGSCCRSWCWFRSRALPMLARLPAARSRRPIRPSAVHRSPSMRYRVLQPAFSGRLRLERYSTGLVVRQALPGGWQVLRSSRLAPRLLRWPYGGRQIRRRESNRPRLTSRRLRHASPYRQQRAAQFGDLGEEGLLRRSSLAPRFSG